MLEWFGKRLRELQEKNRDERGFTLIELLVVVIIIGILAAIAIPVFLGQRESAQDAAAVSAVRNGAVAMETYFAQNQTYVGADADALSEIEPSIDWENMTISNLGATTYTLALESASGNTAQLAKTNDGTIVSVDGEVLEAE